MDLDPIAEFAFDFDYASYEEFSVPSNREVYDIPGEIVDETGLDDDYVLLRADHADDYAPRDQNKRETRVFLESLTRDQGFAVPVLCGRTDFEWVVNRKLNKQDLNPSRQTRPDQPVQEFSKGLNPDDIIPENWINLDAEKEAEIGYDKKRPKVLDTGLMEPIDGWTYDDIFDYPQVETNSFNGQEYFEIGWEGW